MNTVGSDAQGTAVRSLFVETVFGRDLFAAIIAKDGKEGWNAYPGSTKETGKWT